MNRDIQVSKIGTTQLVDVEHSGDELHDEFFRTCTVLQGDPPKSDIGDDVPYRIQKLYGGSIWDWNRHFIVQVSGCPLKCWYCYVDNLKVDTLLSIKDLVSSFVQFRRKTPNLNVFHFMGGCPGRYSYLWREIREGLDKAGLRDCIFLSDIILLENQFYSQTPWEDIPDRAIISVCLKGTNFQNFLLNTGLDYFAQAVHELLHYTRSTQVYYSLLNWDEEDKSHIVDLLGKDACCWMEVKEYEVVKKRRKGKEGLV